jgi:hypothetical protein
MKEWGCCRTTGAARSGGGLGCELARRPLHRRAGLPLVAAAGWVNRDGRWRRALAAVWNAIQSWGVGRSETEIGTWGRGGCLEDMPNRRTADRHHRCRACGSECGAAVCMSRRSGSWGATVRRCACAHEAFTLQSQCLELLLSISFDTYTCYILYVYIHQILFENFRYSNEYPWIHGRPAHGECISLRNT